MLPTMPPRRIVAFALTMLALLATAAAQVDARDWGQNTPGVTLILHEGPRQKSPQGTILWYNLVGQGFPPNVPFTLWRWPPDKDPAPMAKGVSFDKRGVLVCSGRPGFCKGEGPDDPINIKANAVLGEAKRLAVVSPDGKIAGFAEAVPFPIEATDKSCKLSVVRMSLATDAVTVRVSGFAANERLTLKTQTGSEEASIDHSADQHGSWTGVVKLPLNGQGKAFVSVTPVTGQHCKVAVSFDWGPGSSHPM